MQVLQEGFTQFVSETNNIGQQRLEQVNKLVNEMIKCGHSDAATIAEWKDGLNESWADLLELMETRTQMLTASYQLHKFFTDCKEVQLHKKQPVPQMFFSLAMTDVCLVTSNQLLSCVVGAGSDCREDETASRTTFMSCQYY